MADLFGRDPVKQLDAVTADRCTLTWDGKVIAEAMQVSISYNQSVSRRRTIGGKSAVIYGSQPMGQASIALMVTTDGNDIFGTDSWKGCQGGTVMFATKGCKGATSTNYTANGCVVTGYSIQASAEDLTVVQNITIDFLELVAS
jgi:hypothetical protein